MDSSTSFQSPAPKKMIKVKRPKRRRSKKKAPIAKSLGFYDFVQNKNIGDHLQRFGRAYKLLGEHFRSRAYTKALQALEIHVRFPITSGESVVKLENVGVKIVKKIDELLETGAIKSLIELEATPRLKAYEALTKIHGVGYAKAKAWIKQGIYTLDDLKTAVAEGRTKFTKAQKIGVDHFDDLQTKISQNEMDFHRSLITKLFNEEVEGGEEFNITVAGSYRRYSGLPHDKRMQKLSGDVDILITHPSVKTKADMDGKPFLKNIAKAFEKYGYSLGRLSLGKTKYSAVVALPDKYLSKDVASTMKIIIARGVARHLDIRLFPRDTFVYSLFHFTGSGLHNMILRSKALEKGYSLSEYGLVHVTEGPVLGLKTEQDIYKILGEKYIAPHER